LFETLGGQFGPDGLAELGLEEGLGVGVKDPVGL